MAKVNEAGQVLKAIMGMIDNQDLDAPINEEELTEVWEDLLDDQSYDVKKLYEYYGLDVAELPQHEEEVKDYLRRFFRE